MRAIMPISTMYSETAVRAFVTGVCARPDAEQLAHEVRDVLVCDCPCKQGVDYCKHDWAVRRAFQVRIGGLDFFAAFRARGSLDHRSKRPRGIVLVKVADQLARRPGGNQFDVAARARVGP